MSLDEAKTAVLNAARQLRAYRPTLLATDGHGVALLTQLYSAVDACDAVGDAEPEPVMPHGPVVAVYQRVARPGLCQGDPECWRYADVGPTCFHHSPAAQRPRPFERVVRRDAVFEVRDAG